MQAVKKNLSDTKVQLTLTADAKQLASIKSETLQHIAKDMTLPGFRKGKAPLNVVEKNTNPATLQTEFLDRAMNALFVAGLEEHKLHPVAQPKVSVKKFVPFDDLEIEVEIEIIGDIKLADYKKFKVAKKDQKITEKDIEEVLTQLKTRESEKQDVDRAAKDGDQVLIDFVGTDAKTDEAIEGAEGKDYALVLGSKTFIPGFEDNLIGAKAGDEKTFVLTFPKDYGTKVLQNRKVQFKTTVKKVQEVVEPKLDDKFAAKIGPFKTIEDLKADISKQLEAEKNYQADREYADEIVLKLTKESKVAVPEALIEEQINSLVEEQKRNLMYRGQTWQEFLASQDKTEEQYRESVKADAELRVKAGLVLSQVAEDEKIVITPEELDTRMTLLKGQYPDKQMQAEIEKPEARREILARMISEKTIDKLVSHASPAKK